MFVACAQPVYGYGLTAAVSACHDMRLTGQAEDGRRACQGISDRAPDVALIVADLPGLPEVLRQVIRTEVRAVVIADRLPGVLNVLPTSARVGVVCQEIRRVARSEAAPAGVVGPGPRGLSPRSLQCLDLLAADLTRSEIGDRLILSPNTVKVHITNLYAELGVSSKAGAVAEGMRRGLIS